MVTIHVCPKAPGLQPGERAAAHENHGQLRAGRDLNPRRPDQGALSRLSYPRAWSEWKGSNLRLPAPKAGAPPLSYAPIRYGRIRTDDLRLMRPAGWLLPYAASRSLPTHPIRRNREQVQLHVGRRLHLPHFLRRPRRQPPFARRADEPRDGYRVGERAGAEAAADALRHGGVNLAIWSSMLFSAFRKSSTVFVGSFLPARATYFTAFPRLYPRPHAWIASRTSMPPMV